jgi:ferrochelatase
MSRGVLLVNLGTPASPAVSDVRAYLAEFLSDPHVIDLPGPLRQLLLRLVILPFRPRRSAAAYRSIWEAAGPGTGSPLLHHSEALTRSLAERLDMPVALAMRYGAPHIEAAVASLVAQGASEILLLALYPQHADSTRATTIEAVQRALPAGIELRIVPAFHDDAGYLRVQAEQIRCHLPAGWPAAGDHLLLSYHGLPERHLTRADPTGSHCLKRADCCEVPSPAHATCYRHQVRSTSRRLAELLGLAPADYSVSYQSRLGRLPWLTPYTDEVLAALPDRGVRRLAVACPAFVADNLETLEEIGIAGRERFLAAGGESFQLIPCLNDAAAWVEVLAGWCVGDEQSDAARFDTA